VPAEIKSTKSGTLHSKHPLLDLVLWLCAVLVIVSWGGGGSGSDGSSFALRPQLQAICVSLDRKERPGGGGGGLICQKRRRYCDLAVHSLQAIVVGGIEEPIVVGGIEER
jgi:hypothetical protein